MNKPNRRVCGAFRLKDGSVRWRVWAPRANEVELVLLSGEQRRSLPLDREEYGFFCRTEASLPEGQRYFYRLDGGPERPDPCSLWQPEGLSGPSAVLRPEQFSWTDQDWKGIPKQDLVFYELHVGTFSPEGTFEGVIPRLGTLKQLGITALQIMPVGQFPGERNWGYDGVMPYAAQNSYGGPHGLQRLVNACHETGLAVFLDVVYNHLGPEGNYLNEFGPYFTDRYKTPWGQAVNFDGPGSIPVRDYVLDNVRLWLEEFHFDGLRLDAVHATFDLGARHILRSIKEAAQDVSAREKRPLYIIAESDLNDPRLLWPKERGGYGLDAQWSDDFHHAVHTYLTGERQGYYQDFGEAAQLAEVLECPFLYTWDYSPYRDRKHGAPPEGLSGDCFVVCLQNHDQVGNRAAGDRWAHLLKTPAQQRLAASILLFSPYLPLLFMGEEYGEEHPFPFFCSFIDPQLVQAVREGRKREFASFSWQGEVPDPQGEHTFASARLSWSWPEGTHRSCLRRLYSDLLAARREWDPLRNFRDRAAQLLSSEKGPILHLVRGGKKHKPGQTLQVFFNLVGETQRLPGRLLDPSETLLFSSESRRYQGSRHDAVSAREILPHECLAFGSGSWRRL